MTALLRDLGWGLWRLVPANPILVRVVYAGGRRPQHAWIRGLYLAAMTLVVIVLVLLKQNGGGSLAALAKSATDVFANVSILQMFLVCLLAPVFAAGAITQEKDSQTYNILLTTPLSNAQIVLGSLLSRLYFVVMLLIAGIPLFCIMMLYGGVTGREISLSFMLCAATATLTASLAIAVSVIKIGTGRTIFSFYLTIALYLMAVWALAGLPKLIPPEAPRTSGQSDMMSWLAAFHPFLSLWVVLNKTPAPDLAAVAHYGFPRAQLLAYPQYVFAILSFGISGLLIILSMFFVRRGLRVGEPTWIGRVFFPNRAQLGGGSEQTRTARRVWSNPVAWREAVTKAAAGSGGVTRFLVVGGGIIAAIMLVISYARGMTAGEARLWIEGLVGVELFLALFVATVTAATSMTREREANTLDLLLTTPIQGRQIIWGKLLGLTTFAAPMLAAPCLTLAIFVIYDLISGRARLAGGPLVHAEWLLSLPILMIAFAALACVLGLRYSVHHRRTMTAVLVAAVAVGLAFGLPGGCSYWIANSMGNSNPEIGAALTPFSPISAIPMAVDPARYLMSPSPGGAPAILPATARWTAVVSSAVAALLYGLIIWWLYRDLVRTFDMVLRRQST